MMHFRGLGDPSVITTVNLNGGPSFPVQGDVSVPNSCGSVVDCALQSLPASSTPANANTLSSIALNTVVDCTNLANALNPACLATPSSSWIWIAGAIFGSLFLLEVAGARR